MKQTNKILNHIRNWEIKRKLLKCFFLFFLFSCQSRIVPEYSLRVENVQSLKSIETKRLINIEIGNSLSTTIKELLCRLESEIQVSNGTFETYIKNALIEELRNVNYYSNKSKNKIFINLVDINLNTFSNPSWDITLQVTFNDNHKLILKEEYLFESNLYAEAACSNAKWAFMNAVQKLINSIISNPDFRKLLRKKE